MDEVNPSLLGYFGYIFFCFGTSLQFFQFYINWQTKYLLIFWKFFKSFSLSGYIFIQGPPSSKFLFFLSGALCFSPDQMSANLLKFSQNQLVWAEVNAIIVGFLFLFRLYVCLSTDFILACAWLERGNWGNRAYPETGMGGGQSWHNESSRRSWWSFWASRIQIKFYRCNEECYPQQTATAGTSTSLWRWVICTRAGIFDAYLHACKYVMCRYLLKLAIHKALLCYYSRGICSYPEHSMLWDETETSFLRLCKHIKLFIIVYSRHPR